MPWLSMPDEYVGGRICEGVAQMRGVVGSDATDVEARRAVRGLERLQSGRLRVVELHVRRIAGVSTGIRLLFLERVRRPTRETEPRLSKLVEMCPSKHAIGHGGPCGPL